MHVRLVWSLLGLLVSASVACAQAPPPPQALTCEQQVQEQYRKLAADRSLQTTGFAPQVQTPTPTWESQLTSITSQLRKGSTRYEIKENQEKLAVQNVAELLEQLRQAQEQVATLRAELEQLKPPPATPPAPTN